MNKLFTIIASEGIDSLELRNKIPLTRKQYYFRLSRMIRVAFAAILDNLDDRAYSLLSLQIIPRSLDFLTSFLFILM